MSKVVDLLMSDDVVYNLAVLMDTIGKQLPPLAHREIAAFLQMPEVTRGGVLATAQSYVKTLHSPGVLRSLDKLAKLGREKTAAEMCQVSEITSEQADAVLRLADCTGDAESVFAALPAITGNDETALAGIERLQSINSDVSEAVAHRDAVRYIRTNLEFHRTLYLRAQAPAMLAMAETVWLQLGPTMRSLYGRLNRKEPPAHHRHIISALRAGDEPGLRLAVRTDVTQGLRMLKN